ncbi:MAG: hypothetical protein KDI39_22220, partial [Pseudomonadales bacterium]|nr:hypothetical protein [Pseudomonadales bacterium]
MAFRDWLKPTSEAAIVAISAIDDEKESIFEPTIASIATIAELKEATLASNDTQAAIDLDWRKLIYGI